MNSRASTWMWLYLVGLNMISCLYFYEKGLGKICLSYRDFLFFSLLSFSSLYLAVLFLASERHVSNILTCFGEKVNTKITAIVQKKNNPVFPTNQLHTKNIAL